MPEPDVLHGYAARASVIACRRSRSSGATLLGKKARTSPSLPIDVLAEVPVGRLAAAREEGVDRRLSRPGLGLELREHREADTVVPLAEGLDLLRGTRLLTTELVAREAEHREALACELLVDVLEAGILRREPALARHVHDQRDGAAVPCEIGGAAVELLRLQIVERHAHAYCAALASRQDPGEERPSARLGTRSPDRRLVAGYLRRGPRVVGHQERRVGDVHDFPAARALRSQRAAAHSLEK